MKKMFLFLIISLSTFISNAQCSADFTWTVNGGTVQFTNTSSGTNVYQWYFGDGSMGFTTNATHSYSAPGTYDVCLYGYYNDSLGGNCFDSTCHQVVVFQDSTNGTGCSINASIYGNNGNGQLIGINNSAGAAYYNWMVFDSNSGATLTSVSTTNLNYSPGYFGDFWVCLTAYEDSTGFACDSLCTFVTLSLDSLDSNVNVGSNKLLDFALYPNPTNAILFLQLDHLPSKAHAHIVDLLGREMLEVDLTAQVTEIHVGDLPSGIYIVQLLDNANQVIGTRKFIRN